MANSCSDWHPSSSQPVRCKTSHWKHLFFALLVVVMVVVARDFTPRISQQIGRLQMAGDLGDQEFLQRVLSRSREKLVARHSTPVHEQTRLLIVDDMRMLGVKMLPDSWPQAMLAKGLTNAETGRGDIRNLNALREYYDRLVSSDGKWNGRLDQVDQTMHGQILLYLAVKTQDNRYRKAADEMASFLLDRGKVEGGTIPYRTNQTCKLYLTDTLGMICPFLAEYGSICDKPQAMAIAVRQLEDFITFGIEPRTGLPFHGYNPNDQCRPLGVIGWGRGAGWYALGLVDTLPWLDKADPKRFLLEGALRQLAMSLRRYQRTDGGWNELLNAESNYDSSATAMLVYAIQQGVRQRILSEDYAAVIVSGMHSLKQNSRANGTVDFASGVLISLARHSVQYGPTPYAQGMVLAVWANQTAVEALLLPSAR